MGTSTYKPTAHHAVNKVWNTGSKDSEESAAFSVAKEQQQPCVISLKVRVVGGLDLKINY